MRRHALFGFVALALGGCGGDTNAVRDLAMAAGVTGGEPKPAPDFVAQSRPASVDYAPVGVSAPRRAMRAKDAKSVSDAEREMTAIRARNEAQGATARRAGASPPAKPNSVPPPPDE